MRSSNLKQFTIKGLFGDRNVNIPFNNDVKILIGENGLGKTTVLNMLYYTLTNKLYKLRDFDFKSLDLIFTDGQKISIERDKILKADEELEMNVPPSLINQLVSALDPAEILEMGELFKKSGTLPLHFLYDRMERLRFNWN